MALTLPAALTPPAALAPCYVDDALLVFDKPSGLLAVPGRGPEKQDCLSARVQACYPEARVVHRLDMATSGLMLFARGAEVQRRLSGMFAAREVTKRYIAVVAGRLEGPSGEWGVIDLPIALDWPNRPVRVIDPVRGKPSLTRWRMLAYDAAAQVTRLELEPVTGRSHQLRVHLKAIGHPILGDTLYAPPEVQARAHRLLLHAGTLRFRHPLTGQAVRVENQAEF